MLKNEVQSDADGEGLYALAATDGTDRALLVVNHSDAEQTVQTNLGDGFTAYLVDETSYLKEVPLCAASFTLGANQVVLLKA